MFIAKKLLKKALKEAKDQVMKEIRKELVRHEKPKASSAGGVSRKKNKHEYVLYMFAVLVALILVIVLKK